MKDFELFRRTGLVNQCKSLFPEWFFSSLFQLLETKIQIGVSEHVLEKARVAFGLLHFAVSLHGPWVKIPAVNAPPAQGVS